MKPMPSDNDGDEAPAKGPMIKKSHVGRLHAALNVPPGQKIPAAKMAAAKPGASPALKKQIVFAQNARGFNHKGGPKKAAAKPYSFA